jgi:predicted RNase H-like HicB family nuclease
MDIQFTSHIFKEGRMYVAHTPELDVSSCGSTKEKALKNLKEAVRLFLEILDKAGYSERNNKVEGPQFIGTERVSMLLPALHA